MTAKTNFEIIEVFLWILCCVKYGMKHKKKTEINSHSLLCFKLFQSKVDRHYYRAHLRKRDSFNFGTFLFNLNIQNPFRNLLNTNM